jgi:hypothetical protein
VIDLTCGAQKARMLFDLQLGTAELRRNENRIILSLLMMKIVMPEMNELATAKMQNRQT